MQPQPPKWAGRSLAWYCKPPLLENTEGDLHQMFLARVEQEGLREAAVRVGRGALPASAHRASAAP